MRFARITFERLLRRPAPVTGLAAALLVLAACCPVPAGLTATPTAFTATLVEDLGDSWVAQASDGTRHRVTGRAPAPTGSHVYLEGTIEPTGTVTVDRADVIGNP